MRLFSKPPLDQQPELIELNASDSMYDRAAKMWKLLGFVNDRTGMVPQLAAYLQVYRELDANAEQSEGPPRS